MKIKGGEKMNNILHKEIDLIQSCINRMEKNSFSCKGWNLTLVSGSFTLVTENVNKWYICIVILCVDLCFWWLDSFFLLQELKYRNKYEWIIQKRLEGNSDFLYDLNPNNEDMNIRNDECNQLKVAFSKTLVPIYGGIAILILIAIIFKINGEV